MSEHDDLDQRLRALLDPDRLDLPVRPTATATVSTRLRTVRRRRAQTQAALTLVVAGVVGFGAFRLVPHEDSLSKVPGVSGTATITSSPSPSPSVTSSSPAPTTSSPTTSAAATTSSSAGSDAGQGDAGAADTTLVAHGAYGPLKLGMSAADAFATGWIQHMPNEPTKDAPGRPCMGWWPDRSGRGAIFISQERGIEAMVFTKDVHTLSQVTIGDRWSRVIDVYKPQGLVGAEADSEATLPLTGSPAAVMKFTKEYDGTVAEIVLERTDQHCYG